MNRLRTDNMPRLTPPRGFPGLEDYPDGQKFAMQSESVAHCEENSETRKSLILQDFRVSECSRISETRKSLMLQGLRDFRWSGNSETRKIERAKGSPRFL